MKNSKRWLVWIVLIAVLLVGAYTATNGELFRGKAAELWGE